MKNEKWYDSENKFEYHIIMYILSYIIIIGVVKIVCKDRGSCLLQARVNEHLPAFTFFA